jgi:hypothetical protein
MNEEQIIIHDSTFIISFAELRFKIHNSFFTLYIIIALFFILMCKNSAISFIKLLINYVLFFRVYESEKKM